MYDFYSKTARQAKRQENMTHNEEKNQSTEANPDLTRKLKFKNCCNCTLYYQKVKYRHGRC